MARDEVIRMAREAGAAKFYPERQTTTADSYLVGQEFLERFTALVAAAEREECAKVCEARQTPGTGSMAILQGAADAIRARSAKP